MCRVCAAHKLFKSPRSTRSSSSKCRLTGKCMQYAERAHPLCVEPEVLKTALSTKRLLDTQHSHYCWA